MLFAAHGISTPVLLLVLITKHAPRADWLLILTRILPDARGYVRASNPAAAACISECALLGTVYNVNTTVMNDMSP